MSRSIRKFHTHSGTANRKLSPPVTSIWKFSWVRANRENAREEKWPRESEKPRSRPRATFFPLARSFAARSVAFYKDALWPSHAILLPTFGGEECVTGHKNACIGCYMIWGTEKKERLVVIWNFWKPFIKWWVISLTHFQQEGHSSRSKMAERGVWNDGSLNSLF